MKKLLFIALLAVSITANAQNTEPKPVADETFIKVNKTSFKVCTVNQQIFKLILAKYPSIKKYTVLKRKDRVGEYWETEIVFKTTELTEVTAFLKSL